MYAKIRGVEIYFDVHGSGLQMAESRWEEKPVVMVLHGGPGSDHTGYIPWLQPLTDDLQIVYLDHRGNGRSSRPPLKECTMEEMADDAEALRQHLGLGPVLLMGSSFGGMVAQTFAIRYPHSLTRLVLGVTSPSNAFLDEARAISRSRGTPEQVEAAGLILDGAIRDAAHFTEVFRHVAPLYYYRFNPEYEATGRRGQANYEIMNYYFANRFFGYDLRPRLKEIRVPTLVCTGRHDWITPPTQSEALVREIPDVRQVMFEESGHQAMREENQKYLKVVREFLLGQG